MNLLEFCPSYPPRTGGLETHAAEFNEGLSQHKEIDSIVVFTPKLAGYGPERETVGDKITIIRFPAFEVIPNYPFPKIWHPLFWKQWRSLHRPGSTLVLSRTRFFFTSMMAWWYALCHRYPYVHIEHGSDFVQLSSAWKSWVARMYDYTCGAWVLRHSTQNIAISHAVADFIKQFDDRPTPVLYRGVDQELILSTQPDVTYRKQYPEAFLISFVGRLIDGKGVADLFPVAEALLDKNVHFLIIGDGPQESWLKQRAKQLELSNIHFLGRKSRSEAVALVKGSDVFINPSYTEGLPTSVVEAALSRVPIIATDVGGTREIIDHQQSGILIAPRDPESIIRSVKELMADKSMRETMAEQAFLQARRRFSWPETCDMYKDILLKMEKKETK